MTMTPLRTLADTVRAANVKADAMLGILSKYAPRVPRNSTPEPAWYTAFRAMPVREFGMTPAEKSEADAVATLRSVLPNGFEAKAAK